MKRVLNNGLGRVLLALLISQTALAATGFQEQVRTVVDREYTSLFDLYKHLHTHPELSFQEEQTSARVADELRADGFTVTTGVGKYGVVGILSNGQGPTVLVRTDMDALPVKEQTGLAYSSSVIAKDPDGKEVPVMHACGHDMNMTCVLGAARVLAQLKDSWHGTLFVIGQPAEERGAGARAMLADGLFQKFPKPDFCLALHDDAEMAAGTLACIPGSSHANVDSVDIIIHGVGGHGSTPQKTKDPVVLAAQIVLALQTIVSRELEPGSPAVVTVGSIHGGTKHNIIPEEVRLQLTVRSYSDEVRNQTLDAIKRIARGQGLAAGLPEDKLPEVKFAEEPLPGSYNNPELAGRIDSVFKTWFGEENVVKKKPLMAGEDFGQYGRTPEKIPILLFFLGGVSPDAFKESQKSGKPLPTLHSAFWAPLPEPTIKAGVTAMSAAVLDLMGKKK